MDPIFRITNLIVWGAVQFVAIPVLRICNARTRRRVNSIDGMQLEVLAFGALMQYHMGLKGLPPSLSAILVKQMTWRIVMVLFLFSGIFGLANLAKAINAILIGE